ACLGKKKLAQNRFQASSVALIIPRQLSTNSGSNDDDGGGANNGAHCTSSTSAQNSSRSTDKAGSIRMDNNRSRTPGSRFRWKSDIRNPGPEQGPIHVP